MSRTCSTNGKERNSCRIFVGKPERKRPVGRPRRKWLDNIKMCLREMEWCGMEWIDVAQDREHGSCDHGNELRVPLYAGKLSNCTIGGCQEGLSSVKLVGYSVTRYSHSSSRNIELHREWMYRSTFS
jgi:hypothetical protein